MTLRIELQTTWRLWPLVTWNWFYFGWRFCDHCGRDGHDMKRSITIRVELPFAQVIFQPGIEFKTWVAKNGCPERSETAVAA